jgi:fructokinase
LLRGTCILDDDGKAGIENMVDTNKRVAVFGEALVDVFHDKVVPGGAPFNVARHLAAFGVQVCMITRIGTDANAAYIHRELDRFGMDRTGIQVDPLLPTGAVSVRMTPHGHEFDIPDNQAFDSIDGKQAIAALAAFGEVDAICYGTLIQRAARSCGALAETLAACPRATRYLDLNLRKDGNKSVSIRDMLFNATILKVSDEELAEIATAIGAPAPQAGEPDLAAIDRAIQAVLHAAPSLKLLIATLGKHGSVAYPVGSGSMLYRPGAEGVSVVDTVGAGDAFSSVMILGRLQAWPLATMLERANAFAAAICTVRGAVPGDLDFYRSWIDEWSLGHASNCA